MDIDRTMRLAVLCAVLAALLSAGCGRKQDKTPAASKATNAVPAAQVQKSTTTSAVPATPHGAPTNTAPGAPGAATARTGLVYTVSGMYDWYAMGDEDVTKLSLDCAGEPDNPDAWFKLGFNCQDYSNQVVCLERAVALAPDAFMPRLALAGARAELGGRQAAFTAFTGVYDRVSSPGELGEWVGCFTYDNSSAMFAFVSARAQTDKSPATLAAQAMLAIYADKQDEAVRLAGAALSNNTLGSFGGPVMDALLNTVQYRERDSAWSNKYALVEAYGTPYQKTTVQMMTMTPAELRGRGSTMLQEALRLATNNDMRIMAVRPFIMSTPKVADMPAFVAALTNACDMTSPIYLAWMRRVLSNVGETNLAREMALKACTASNTTSAMLRMALQGAVRSSSMTAGTVQRPDLELVELLRSRFPSNQAVLGMMADAYARAEYAADETACRRQVMALTSNDLLRAHNAGPLLNALVKQGSLDEARVLADEYAGQASSNPALALAVCSYLFAANRTNDACDLLMNACRNTWLMQCKSYLLQKLLEVKQPSVSDRQRVARFALGQIAVPDQFNTYVDRGYVRGHVFSSITYSLVRLLNDAGMPDDAASLAASMYRKSGVDSGFRELVTSAPGRQRTAHAIRSLVDAGFTQQVALADLAEVSKEARDYPLALDLAFRALRADGEQPKVYSAIGALRLAAQLGDQNRIGEAAAMIEAMIRDGRIPLEQLADYGTLESFVRKAGLGDKLDTWYALAWQQCTTKTSVASIRMMSDWYLRHGQTNRVQQLIQPMLGADRSVDDRVALCDMLRRLGDREGCRRLIDLIRPAFTNAPMIEEHGREFLALLRSQAELGDPRAAAEVRALVIRWAAEPDLGYYARQSLCRELGAPGDAWAQAQAVEAALLTAPPRERDQLRLMLASAYVACGNTGAFLRVADEIRSSPDSTSYSIRQLIESYIACNMAAEAIVLCEQIASQCGNEYDQANLLGRTARLYVTLGDNAQAIRSIEEALAQVPEYYRNTLYDLAGKIYADTGENKKGIEMLAHAFASAKDGAEACSLAERIAAFATEAELACDGKGLAETLLAFDRTPDTSIAASGLLLTSGDVEGARTCLRQALNDAQLADEKSRIYAKLVKIAEAEGNRVEQLKLLEERIRCVDADERGECARQIADACLTAGNPKTAAERAAAFLSSRDSQDWPAEAKDGLRSVQMDAQVAQGDTDAAWETARSIGDYKKFVTAAKELGRIQDAVPRLEEELASGDADKRVEVATTLLGIYREAEDQDGIKKLASHVAELAEGQSPQVVLQVARVFEQAGKADDALAFLKTAVAQATPEDQHALDARITAMLGDAKNYDDALAWLNGRPQDGSTLALKAKITAAQGEPEDAVALYCAALRVGESACATELRSLLGSASGPGSSLASAAVDELLKGTGADDPAMHQEAAAIYQQAGQFTDALEQFKKAADLARTDALKQKYLEQYAACCATARKYETAIDTYTDLLKDDRLKWEQRDRLRQSLADVCDQSGRQSRASDICQERIRDCEDYIKRMKFTTDTTTARFKLADLYHQANDDNGAIRVLKKIAEEYGTGANAKRAAGELKKYGR